MSTAPPNRTWPLAPFLPWTDGSGRAWPGWRRLPPSIPFVIAYIVVAWVLFIPAAEARGGLYWIDEDAVGHLLFRIPFLFPIRAKDPESPTAVERAWRYGMEVYLDLYDRYQPLKAGKQSVVLSPEEAYEPAFMERLVERSGWKLGA